MNRAILVVDDDPGMVRTMCDVLRLSGWEADGVHSGEEAVTAACEKKYLFVVMDIMMPGLDGVGALKAIKVCHPDACVILMTAHSAADRVMEAERAGALRVMIKPVDLPSLFQILEHPQMTETQAAPGLGSRADRSREPLAGRRILVVDDNCDAADSLGELLRYRGAIVTVRYDGAAALAVFDEFAPHALVLDIGMPGMDGYELARQVRARESAIRPVLITQTGRSNETDRQRAAAAGIEHFLVKPVALSELELLLEPA